MRFLWLPFMLLPLAEIVVFFKVVEEIGFLNALGISVLTAFIGVVLVQQQGFDTLMRAQRQLRDGRLPLRELFHGLCLIVAGFLLIIPGFMSDTLGALLLIPPVRERIRLSLVPRMQETGPEPGVIDGAFERVDKDPPGRLRG